MRLITHDVFRVPCKNHVTHVVVKMFRLAGPRRYDVYVEIKDLRMKKPYIGDTTLLTGLRQRYSYDVVVPISMSTELQPLVQLSVVRQERMVESSVDNPRGTGNVSLNSRTMEAHRLTKNKGQKSFRNLMLCWISLNICFDGLG